MSDQFIRAISLESLHASVIEDAIASKESIHKHPLVFKDKDSVKMSSSLKLKEKLHDGRKFPKQNVSNRNKVSKLKTSCYLDNVESIGSLYLASQSFNQQSYPQLVLGPLDDKKAVKDVIHFRPQSVSNEKVSPSVNSKTNDYDFCVCCDPRPDSSHISVPRVYLSPLKPPSQNPEDNTSSVQNLENTEKLTSIEPKSWLWTSDILFEKESINEETSKVKDGKPLQTWESYFSSDSGSDDNSDSTDHDTSSPKLLKRKKKKLSFHTIHTNSDFNSRNTKKKNVDKKNDSNVDKDMVALNDKTSTSGSVGSSFFWGTINAASENDVDEKGTDETTSKTNAFSMDWETYVQLLGPSWLLEHSELLQSTASKDMQQSDHHGSSQAGLQTVSEIENEDDHENDDNGNVVSADNFKEDIVILSNDDIFEKDCSPRIDQEDQILNVPQLNSFVAERLYREVERSYEIEQLEETLAPINSNTEITAEDNLRVVGAHHTAHAKKHFFHERYQSDFDNESSNSSETYVHHTFPQEVERQAPTTTSNEPFMTVEQADDVPLIEATAEDTAHALCNKVNHFLEDFDLLARHRTKALQIAEQSEKLYAIRQVDPSFVPLVINSAEQNAVPVSSSHTKDSSLEMSAIFERIQGLHEDLQMMQENTFSVRLSSAYQQCDRDMKQRTQMLQTHPLVANLRSLNPLLHSERDDTNKDEVYASVSRQLDSLTDALSQAEDCLANARDTLPQTVREIVRQFHRHSEQRRQQLALEASILLSKISKLSDKNNLSDSCVTSHGSGNTRTASTVALVEALGKELRLTQTCEAMFLEHARLEEASITDTLKYWRPRLQKSLEELQLAFFTAKSHRHLRQEMMMKK